MVTFVSQCEKKSLNKTRRVLDAFANRIGDNTWQTTITQEGLLVVKKLLRKTASKNTAVSCHWIRSRSRSELVWVVGNKNKFNEQGFVPVNRTRRNLLKNNTENDWNYLPLIKGLVALSALLHDWGKATSLFQSKLNPQENEHFRGDPIRHEWISLLLLNTFVQTTNISSDEEWLNKLSRGEIDDKTLTKQIKKNNPSKPLKDLPPIAKLIAWLIVSHHRLPLPVDREHWSNFKSASAESLDAILNRISKEWGYENRVNEKEYQQHINSCFTFPNGLMSNSKKWIQQIKKWSTRLIYLQDKANTCIINGSYRLIISHARLCLMLGDHNYSSQKADPKWKDITGLYANTDRQTNVLKQKLDEHLVGVAKKGLETAHLLPSFEIEPPVAQDVKSLSVRSPKPYGWQDKAVDKIKCWRHQFEQGSKKKYGFFTVNMASTGCGKTYANAKVMRTLSNNQKSLRFVLALGLRTLTLQTGHEYRERIGLDNSELAVLIGSRAVQELDRHAKMDEEKHSYENSGSISEEPLLDEGIDYDCALPKQNLDTVLNCIRDKQFLYSPVLTCTIDHLMAATETIRGGRYILPTLRLMSSDLVIDEIDDFTGDDLIAIGRLIHLAGMLGRKVMISSATIPPYLAEGYFKTYRDGWQLFCQTRDTSETIGCAWIDEFSTQVTSNKLNNTSENNKDAQAIGQYRQEHHQFIEKRVAKLEKQPAKRKAKISNCQHIIDDYKKCNHNDKKVHESKQKSYFKVMLKSALEMHDNHHFVDDATNFHVSFGVIRVANIKPCVALTQYLLETDLPKTTEVRVMAYHSQQVLLLRSNQEKHLDHILKRKEKDGMPPEALKNTIIRQHLTSIKSTEPNIKNIIFILVATPVEEVGRDHDFDWAVVEPSSYRSIIQLAGRVRRHRENEVGKPNIALMQYNLKGITNYHKENMKVFRRPGFEEIYNLTSHDIKELINVDSISRRLDAIPRIQHSSDLTINYLRRVNKVDCLAKLEHVATWKWLANYTTQTEHNPQTGPHTLPGWLKHHWFLTALPQRLAPFRKSDKTLNAYLVYDEAEQTSKFCEKDEHGYPYKRENSLNIFRLALSENAAKRLWLDRCFERSCIALAEQQNKTQRQISLRYGELNFRHNEHKYYSYNDHLGLVER